MADFPGPAQRRRVRRGYTGHPGAPGLSPSHPAGLRFDFSERTIQPLLEAVAAERDRLPV